MPETENQRIVNCCKLLADVSASVRILSHLGWHGRVRGEFFRAGKKRLPAPQYAPYDATAVLRLLEQARHCIRANSTSTDVDINGWLERQAQALESGARMLTAVGSFEFYAHSRQLYGAPDDVLTDHATTSLALASQFLTNHCPALIILPTLICRRMPSMRGNWRTVLTQW